MLRSPLPRSTNCMCLREAASCRGSADAGPGAEAEAEAGAGIRGFSKWANWLRSHFASNSTK
eukprot:scaffold85951_cov53-Phaeocystis_antarctica.AAC.1